MPEQTDHRSCVDSWLGLLIPDQAPERLVVVLEVGVAAIWRRVHPVVGEDVMRAIADQVLREVGKELPNVRLLGTREGGLICEGLYARAASLPPSEIAAGVRMVLVGLLTVLGRLTCELLTPALHAELWEAAVARGPPEAGDRRGLQP